MILPLSNSQILGSKARKEMIIDRHLSNNEDILCGDGQYFKFNYIQPGQGNKNFCVKDNTICKLSNTQLSYVQIKVLNKNLFYLI